MSKDERKCDFEIGDTVDWLGLIGVVDFVCVNSAKDDFLGIRVSFLNAQVAAFTLDGRYFPDQYPSVKLVSRKKKKVKLEGYLNIYSNGSLAAFHTLTQAQDAFGFSHWNIPQHISRTHTVKFTTEEYEE